MIDKFVEYGRNYVQFFIVGNEKEAEWKDVDFEEFRKAMANANCPPFDPVKDLHLPDNADEDGSLYDVAIWEAWSALVAAVAIWARGEK